MSILLDSNKLLIILLKADSYSKLFKLKVQAEWSNTQKIIFSKVYMYIHIYT